MRLLLPASHCWNSLNGLAELKGQWVRLSSPETSENWEWNGSMAQQLHLGMRRIGMTNPRKQFRIEIEQEPEEDPAAGIDHP
jgi:hypothetical protein